MKEFSVEEKAKAYDERFAKAKEVHDNENDVLILHTIEDIFPELKESEGERVRKDIVEAVELHKDFTQGRKEHIYAWLEKQSKVEQAMREQKSAGKIEPKFRDGDWISHNTMDFIFKVESSGYGGYSVVSRNGFARSISFDSEGYYHLWTIEDARDGDVLAYVTDEGDLWIMIYWSLYEPYEGHVHYHALLVNNNFSDKGTCCICTDNLKPATKEQRDLLFSKMKEAGYEWDEENKELKKIEQKPAMIQWKGDNLKEVIDFTGKDKNFDKWFKSFDEYEIYVHEHNNILKLFNEDGSHYEVPVGAWIVRTPDGYNVASKAVYKQNPAWSKEDCNQIEIIVCHLDNIGNGAMAKSLLNIMDKYKSYRPQNHWKPSDLQMTSITCAVRKMKKSACYDSELVSLLNDLKKLKGE